MSGLSKSQTIKSLTITNQFAIDILLLNTPSEIWQYLAQNIVEKLGFEDAVIYTLDEGGETLSRRAGFEKKAIVHNDKSSNIEIKKRYQLLLAFHKVKKEFRNEKFLMLYMLNFILLRSDINLENMSFM